MVHAKCLMHLPMFKLQFSLVSFSCFAFLVKTFHILFNDNGNSTALLQILKAA